MPQIQPARLASGAQQGQDRPRRPDPEPRTAVLEERRLRVLHFSNSTVRGGAEEHMLTLLRGLDRARFELHLACSPRLRSQLPDLPSDVRVLPLDLRAPWQVGAALRLAQYLRQPPIDIVHSHLFCASRFASPLARMAQVPVVIETPHLRESWRQGWKRSYALDRMLAHCVDGYIAVSQANAAYLCREKRLPQAKVRTIINGIDLSRFMHPPQMSEDPRTALGIKPTDLVLLCVARLEPQKGHETLLHALAALQQLPGIARPQLVCLGTGRLQTALETQTRALGLTERVHFPGQCRHVENWLAVADIFVLPSLYEGLPLAAIEAAAAGRAVVATAVDGTPEIIHDGWNGLLTPPGDAPALAAALLRLIADPMLRQRLGQNGRRLAQERFDQKLQIQATGDFYCSLYQIHRKPIQGRNLPVAHGPWLDNRGNSARENHA